MIGSPLMENEKLSWKNSELAIRRLVPSNESLYDV
jgi:hypothetical protein